MLNKGTTGTIFITSLVWLGPWLGIEPGTSRTRSQHSTTRLLRSSGLNRVQSEGVFQNLFKCFKFLSTDAPIQICVYSVSLNLFPKSSIMQYLPFHNVLIFEFRKLFRPIVVFCTSGVALSVFYLLFLCNKQYGQKMIKKFKSDEKQI